jgi:hypothetical protein
VADRVDDLLHQLPAFGPIGFAAPTGLRDALAYEVALAWFELSREPMRREDWTATVDSVEPEKELQPAGQRLVHAAAATASSNRDGDRASYSNSGECVASCEGARCVG